jgi:hypothetical protein
MKAQAYEGHCDAEVVSKYIKSSEWRARRILAIEAYRLQKTPPEHSTRKLYRTGYMIFDSRGVIVEGARQREYDATLEDVGSCISERLKRAMRDDFGIEVG